MKRRPKISPKISQKIRKQDIGKSLILQAGTRLLVSLMLLFSIFLLLRGHNEPGGGFAAGLVAVTAFVLSSIAEGSEAVRQALRFDPRIITASGLALAAFSGLMSMVAGEPFMTGLWVEVFGHLIGTPLIFDLGVYLTVVGAVLSVILALEEED